MWITPVAFEADGAAIAFEEPTAPVPLPPWSGVPVALEMEIERDALSRFLRIEGQGVLRATDEEGIAVQCAAVVDPHGCHSCETDTVLVLIQCGPVEARHT